MQPFHCSKPCYWFLDARNSIQRRISAIPHGLGEPSDPSHESLGRQACLGDILAGMQAHCSQLFAEGSGTTRKYEVSIQFWRHAGIPKSFKHAHTGPAVRGHSLNSKHSLTNAELPTSFFLASAWCLRVREWCSPVLCTARHATRRLSPLLGRGQRASHSIVFFVVVVVVVVIVVIVVIVVVHTWTYLHGRHRVPTLPAAVLPIYQTFKMLQRYINVMEPERKNCSYRWFCTVFRLQ